MSSVAPAADDRTVYPVEERVGEDILQRWIVELLRPLLQRWFDERGQLALVGADQFIYFKQFDAHERVSPDVYHYCQRVNSRGLLRRRSAQRESPCGS
jgi:hypothetical protein